MVRFLLGELSEEETSRVEERFLGDNLFFEQLLAVEQALIDDHVQGRLSPRENTLFEQMILSSAAQANELEAARSLIDQVIKSKPPPEPRASWWRNPFRALHPVDYTKQLSMAGLLLTALFAGSMTIWTLHLQSRLRQVEAARLSSEARRDELSGEVERQAGRSDELSRQLAAEREERNRIEQALAELQQANSKPEISISLDSNSTSRGGGELKSVGLYPLTRRLTFHLDVEGIDRFQSYGATIRSFEGRQIRNGEIFLARRSGVRSIVLTLPASLFDKDDYILTVKGNQKEGESVDLGDFAFRVRKQ